MATYISVPAVPDVKEEEWRLGQVTCEGDRGPDFKLPAIFQGPIEIFHGADKEQLRAAKNAHNASIQRVLEKKDAPSDNVKAQPDDNLMRAAFGQKDASPSPLVSEADKEKNLEEPGDVEANAVQGPMELQNVNTDRRGWVNITPEDATDAELNLVYLISGCRPEWMNPKQWRINMRACAKDIRAHVSQARSGSSVEPAGPKSEAASEFPKSVSDL